MNDIHFYIVDTETNGLNVRMHEIFQLSIIRCDDRMQLSREIMIDKPELSSYDALRITGKTLDDLKRGITKLQLINELDEFLKEDGAQSTHRCMVAHNANFDRNFLCEMWGRYNRKFPFDLYLDTIHMYRAFEKARGQSKVKANLTAACEATGIKKLGDAHNAKTDTRHTFLLWQELSKTVDFLDHIKHIPHNLEL